MVLDWIRARCPLPHVTAGLSALSLVCLIGAAKPPAERPARPAAVQAVAAAPEPAAPAPAAEKPAAPAEKAVVPAGVGPLEITVLRVGQPPYVWGEADARTGRRPLLSFITDDVGTCRVMAWARVNGRPAADREIRWQIEPPAGFALEAEPAAGAALRATLTRAGTPPATVGPLSLTVRASVEVDGQRYEVTQTVTQDARDQMRQEYVDLERSLIPERYRFLDAEQFAERFGNRFPSIRFEEINYSLNPATGERYPYAIVTQALMLGLKRAERLLGSEFVFTSAYRNPRRQEQVHAPVDESQHQYGYAADLLVLPSEGREAPDEADWLRMAEAACAVGAHFVEPLTACHPNSVSCHLHMDFRESGTVTVPVRIKGVVRDAVTGEPIPDALITYGGMPARTGANGYFALRNVLSARERPLEVTAAGYAPLTQPLEAAGGTQEVKLTLQPGPRPNLTVAAGPAHWKNEAAGVGALELRVQNSGAAEARDVRLSAPGFQIAPERVPALPAGKMRKISVFFRRERDAAPGPLVIALEAAYASPEGRALAQSLPAEVAAPAWSTAPAAPAAVSRTAPVPAPHEATVPDAPRPGATNTAAVAGGTAAAAAGSTAAALGAVTLQRRKQRKGDGGPKGAAVPPSAETETAPGSAPVPGEGAQGKRDGEQDVPTAR